MCTNKISVKNTFIHTTVYSVPCADLEGGPDPLPCRIQHSLNYQKYASDRSSQTQIIGKFSGSAHEYVYTFCISLDLFTTALKLSGLSEY